MKNGAPQDAIAALNAAVNKAIGRTQVRDAMMKLGYDPAGGSPSELGKLIAAQVAYWRKIIAESGIKMPE